MHPIPFTLKDCLAASHLHKQAFFRAWDEKSFYEMLSSPSTYGLKLEDKKAVVGYILWREVKDEAEILTLIIAPKYRRKGYATLLLQTVMKNLIKEKLSKLFIEVAKDNLEAQLLYRNLGFTFLNERPNYYLREGGQSISALIFLKLL